MQKQQRIQSLTNRSAIYTPSLLLLVGIVGISGIGLGFISPLRALYGRQIGATSVYIGFMASSYFLAGFLTAPSIGWLADHIGHKRVLWVGLLAHTLLVLAYIPIRDPLLLIVIHAMEGIAAATVLPPARAMINITAPTMRQSEAVSLLTASTYIGYLLGPIVGTFLASQVGYTWSFLLASLPLGISVVIVLFLPSPSKQQHTAEITPDRKRPVLLPHIAFGPLFARPLSLAYVLALIIDATQYINTAVWILYMQDRGASFLQIGLSFTIFGVIIILFSPLAGRFSDRHGRYRQLILGLFLMGTIFCIYSLPLSAWELVLCSGGEGIATVILSSALDGFLADVAPEGMKGQVQANFSAASTLGGFIGATTAGILYVFAQHLPFISGGLLCLLTGCIVLLPNLARLFPDRNRK